MLIIGILSTDPAAVPGTVFLLEGWDSRTDTAITRMFRPGRSQDS
jgi:hypothetical protein